MARRLRDAVVVITGASSGIGRATALAFARRGSKVVLASRHEPSLRVVAQECEDLGTSAIVAPTDVRDEAAVNELAERAAASFGRIDVWVNNAAVFMVGKLDQVPTAAFHQLIHTNLFGPLYGARAALPHLKQSKGVLINVASLAATMGVPYNSAYVSSKWALRGLSECLRQELLDEGVAVVTIMPASIDTPLFEHAANYTGRALKPMDPIYPPERVAATIVARARRPRAEVPVGKVVNASRVLRTVLPTATFERMVARKAERNHFVDRPTPPRQGNLEQPQPPFQVKGGWLDGQSRRRLGLGKMMLATGLCLAAIPAAVALGRTRQRQRLLAALLG
jgi:NAD(P)-dependent dehydrogenase (short-subunit alcohol dehydrogenase family)